MHAARIVAFAVLVALLAILGRGPAGAQDRRPSPRLALVIGEAAYPQGRLATADADAGLMATAFAQAGFDVTALADADASLVRRAILDFTTKVRAAGPSVVLAVYVSGYGLQYAGENWLVPVGARVDADADVTTAAMRLAEFAHPLEGIPAAARLFLFDVARATPFARKGPPLAAGLALADAPVGSIYAYDTAPGAVAPADVPPYGSYARAMAEAMQVPGLSLAEVLRRVRLRVGERTDGAAVPFDDGSAEPGFAFFPGAPSSATSQVPTALPPAAGLTPQVAYSTAIARDTLPGYVDFVAAFPRDPLVGRVRAMAAARREALIWSEAVRADTPRGYWTYMRRYPRGPHFGDVRRQLFALHAALEPPPRFDIVTFEGLPPPPPEEVTALEHLSFAATDGPPIPPPPATLLPAPRNTFFDALPPPPIAPAGALPLPLPVLAPDGQGHAPGRIEEPAVPDGALVATLGGDRDGATMTLAKADGTILSRLAATAERGVHTLLQTASDGALISKVTLATGADGALTTIQVGPAERLLNRAVSREASGGRAITLFDASGQAVAATLVSQTDIVTVNAVIPGQTLPPRFILLPGHDPKGTPAIVPAGEMALRAALPAEPAKVEPVTPATKEAASKTEVGKDGDRQDGKAAAASPASVSPAVAMPTSASASTVKAPALPVAAGLTGQAPALNIPPPPPTPAFDAAAAPVVVAPMASESPAVSTAKPAAEPAQASAKPDGRVAQPAPPLAPAPLAARPAASKAEARSVPMPAPEAARLPSEPPLPPHRLRATELKAKPRAKR